MKGWKVVLAQENLHWKRHRSSREVNPICHSTYLTNRKNNGRELTCYCTWYTSSLYTVQVYIHMYTKSLASDQAVTAALRELLNNFGRECSKSNSTIFYLPCTKKSCCLLPVQKLWEGALFVTSAKTKSPSPKHLGKNSLHKGYSVLAFHSTLLLCTFLY